MGNYHHHQNPSAFKLDLEIVSDICNLYDADGLYFIDETIHSPLIGFAFDGFPIYGSWFDDNGLNRKATSSYQLKAGARPSGAGEPGGNYDGTYRDDYEYVQGSGDLDECNGMTVDGVYGYYIIDAFPYVLGCFKGVPDLSFRK